MAETHPSDNPVLLGLPDFGKDFVNNDRMYPSSFQRPFFWLFFTDITAFEKAINAPDAAEEDFITALNDWRPVKQKVKRKKRKPRRGKDETREGQ